MSQESTTPDLVELVRGILRAADRADFGAILRLYAPDAVWDMRGTGSYAGVDAIRGLWQDYYGSYEEFRLEVEEILDFGNGVILAVNQQQARPVGSAGHVHTREAFIYEWEEGLVVRVTMYGDIDEARAAAERLAEERG